MQSIQVADSILKALLVLDAALGYVAPPLLDQPLKGRSACIRGLLATRLAEPLLRMLTVVDSLTPSTLSLYVALGYPNIHDSAVMA